MRVPLPSTSSSTSSFSCHNSYSFIVYSTLEKRSHAHLSCSDTPTFRVHTRPLPPPTKVHICCPHTPTSTSHTSPSPLPTQVPINNPHI
ncbi:hypothetical protein Pcinc_039241 [Petrolisthes cinctipes]|uniref:Uncharacterized protein n=1 Tax=Petrolisthes cinctipes TaxID=88211 RepID=A0AAE1BRR1_PETCI|nr:hypothetical protein Pcinc_039241 [Petrolisthes cinctipes]